VKFIPDTGDTVFHRPTMEVWVVAHVDGEHLYWIGWPPGCAMTEDCTPCIKASPAQRQRDLLMIANSSSSSDPRIRTARATLWREAQEKEVFLSAVERLWGEARRCGEAPFGLSRVGA